MKRMGATLGLLGVLAIADSIPRYQAHNDAHPKRSERAQQHQEDRWHLEGMLDNIQPPRLRGYSVGFSIKNTQNSLEAYQNYVEAAQKFLSDAQEDSALIYEDNLRYEVEVKQWQNKGWKIVGEEVAWLLMIYGGLHFYVRGRKKSKEEKSDRQD